MPLQLSGSSRRGLAVTAVVLAFSAGPHDAAAWSQTTHKRIVVDAFSYMAANPDTTQHNEAANAAEPALMRELAAAQASGGLTPEQLAEGEEKLRRLREMRARLLGQGR